MDAIRRQLVRQHPVLPLAPALPLLITGKEIQIKMLLDAMQNSFNFVPARNAHYAERERGGEA